MNITRKTVAIVGAALLASVSLAGCDIADDGVKDTRKAQSEQNKQKFDVRTPPDVTGDTEYNNYIKAQELYDDPANIIWCTATWANSAAPIFTVPIAGKLTSSSVSYFPSSTQKFDGNSSYGYTWSEENPSVDGMYHGNPGPYRYGFTPGGQYVDFTGMETFCTTQLTEFQRQTLTVSNTAPEDSATAQAEEKLKAGDAQGAQDILDGIGG
jgi:hypothetical protein